MNNESTHLNLNGAQSKSDSWEVCAGRIVICSTDFLSFSGEESAGGRQRYIRDIATLIKDVWKRDVLVVQKASKYFERTTEGGIPVVGIRSDLTAKGDPGFAIKARKTLKKKDVVLYASGEDAWPFFANNSKAIQHGIWWDGPQPWLTRRIQRMRAFACLRIVNSMLCVDTNFINWVRGFGKEGLELSQKCHYIPNYADISRIREHRNLEGAPLRLICARRYEEKRGVDLFVEALGILKSECFEFSAQISCPGGVEKVQRNLRALGLDSSRVNVTADSMDDVLQRYAHADVAVVPTIWSEGTSLACVEAICAGVPVVATPVGGLGNLIVPGFNGFLVQPNASAIARAIMGFSDRTLLAQMQENCRSMRSALSLQTWQRQVLSWLRE